MDNVWTPRLPSQRLQRFRGISNADHEHRARKQTGIASVHKTNQKQSPVDGYDIDTRRLLEVKSSREQTNMRIDKAGLDSPFVRDVSGSLQLQQAPDEVLDHYARTGNLSISSSLERRCPDLVSFLQDLFCDYVEDYVACLKQSLPTSTWRIPTDASWTWCLGLCFVAGGEERLCIVEEDNIDQLEFRGIHKGRVQARLRRRDPHALAP